MLAMRRKPAHHRRRRPSFFRPVALRTRVDGWTETRQCEFLAQLYVTGSVIAAARATGMTPMSAYRLRARAGAESFAWAWDRIIAPPGSGHVSAPVEDLRKVTICELVRRVEADWVRPVVYRGRMVGVQRKPENSALFALLRRQGTLPSIPAASTAAS